MNQLQNEHSRLIESSDQKINSLQNEINSLNNNLNEANNKYSTLEGESQRNVSLIFN